MTLKLLATLKTRIGDINSLAFSPDGKLIAVGVGGYLPVGSAVQIWDVATHEQRLKLDDFNNPVTSIAFSPDSALLATGEGDRMGFDGSTKIWNIGTGKLLVEFSQETQSPMPVNAGVFGIDFNPDGTLLATTHGNGNVQLWDMINKQEKIVLNEYNMFGVTFSPDGTILAISGCLDETCRTAVIRLWDVATGELLETLNGNTAYITNITFNPDGKMLASASSDGSVKLWDVKTGEILAALDIPDASSVAFSPDGTLLATDGGIVRLWGVPTQQESTR
jgi:WD40 repeat protein